MTRVDGRSTDHQRGASAPHAWADGKWPRAWLFTPADDARRLAAALCRGSDVVIADLEDGVAAARKQLARENVLGFLAAEEREPRPHRIVRINDPDSDHGRRDLLALQESRATALMVPKASVRSLELARAASAGAVVALIETARGVAEAEVIATREEVVGIALGTLDLAAELGLGALPDGLELLHVRSRIVLACALAEIPAIDGVHVNVADAEALAAEADRARSLGFTAKLCVHPAQIDVVQAAFAPTAAELAHARAVLDAYDRALARAHGATLAGDEMVDRASVRRARRVIQSASVDRAGAAAVGTEGTRPRLP